MVVAITGSVKLSRLSAMPRETPVRKLYLCGSGSHPGGGVMGAPGKLAAEAILGGS